VVTVEEVMHLVLLDNSGDADSLCAGAARLREGQAKVSKNEWKGVKAHTITESILSTAEGTQAAGRRQRKV